MHVHACHTQWRIRSPLVHRAGLALVSGCLRAPVGDPHARTDVRAELLTFT